MTAYFIFIAIVMTLIFCDYLQNRERYGVYMLVALAVTILFTSIRYNNGYDYENYTNYFNMPDIMLASNVEWGYVGFVYILRMLGFNAMWHFFAVALISVIFVFRGARLYTTNVRMFFLIYLLIPGLFLNSFTYIRQTLAIAFLFNSYYYFYNHQRSKYWSFVILSVIFHYSAIVVLPLFWIANKLTSKAQLILIILVPLSLILAQLNFLNTIFTLLLGDSKFAVYIGMEDRGTSIAKLLVLNVSVIPYLFFYNRMDRFNRSLMILAVFGLAITNIFASVAAITRISYYLRIFEAVLLANTLQYFKRGGSRMIYVICLIIYFGIMFVNALYYDMYSYDAEIKLTPYRTIFDVIM